MHDDLAPGSRSVLRHRRPTSPEAARRGADRRMDHRQPGGMGDPAAHGPAGPARADGKRAHPRRAQLVVARVRDAGRLLALQGALRSPRDPPDPFDQRQGLRELPAGRRSLPRCGVGVHGAQLRADAHPRPRGSACDHPAIDRRHREVHRQKAARLARAWTGPDLRDARLAGRGRDQVHRRLGLRRRADRDPDGSRAAGDAALHAGAERHPDDDGPAPRIGIPAAAREGQLRSALRGGGRASQDHGHCRPSLHQRRPSPDQVPGGDLRTCRPVPWRALLEWRADPRLVSRGGKGDGGLSHLSMLAFNALNGVTFAALLFVVASGFTLIFGLMRIVNLAHGALYLIGGYIGLTVTTKTGSFLAGSAAAAATIAVIGFLTDTCLLRFVKGHELRQVLLALGVALVLDDLALVVWGGDTFTVPVPRALQGPLRVGVIAYPRYRLFVLAVGLAIFLGLWILLHRTRLGALIRAGVDDLEMVDAMGVDIKRVFIYTFMCGCALAGLGGMLGGAFLSLYPSADVEILVFSLAVVIIGGRGSLVGAGVGSLLVGMLATFGQVWFPELAYFVIFGPMAILLAFRPLGLFGRAA